MRYRRNPRNRRGVETIELILVLPILVIVLIFSVQFAIVSIYQSTVVHAATVAAREAAKDQAAGQITDFDKVVAAVQHIVSVNCIQISDAVGSGTKVMLEDGGSLADPPQSPFVLEYGDPSLDCPLPANALDPNQVRVTVCVDLSATKFCDALAPWGVTFLGRKFRASSLVVKEYEQDLGVGMPL